MNFSELKITLFLFLLLSQFTVIAQSNYDSANDQEFNLFLMILLTVFVCGLFGAAVVGAMIATLFAIIIFSLIAFGIVSTSVAIGIYKRSISAGFKTFLFILLGGICGTTGAVLAMVVQYNWHIATSSAVAIMCGFLGGMLGGITLTALSVKAVRYLIAQAVTKLKLL